jgi:hypothetical protein
VTAVETETRGSRPGELHRRRVLLLAESAGLAAVLHHLLDPADRLSRIGSLRELTETRALESADVVVLDVPTGGRAGAVDQIRRRYLGPLVVLVARGEDTGWLHVDDAATLLVRPFSAEELAAALAASGRPVPAPRVTSRSASTARSTSSTATRAAPADPDFDPKAAARQASVRQTLAAATGRGGLLERGRRLLISIAHGWRVRRRIRVAGISTAALVAFAVAFALAAQGTCGPGCDAFGMGFSPAPTITASRSHVPSTTGPKRSAAATAGTESPGTGAFRGNAVARPASTTTAGRLATTTTFKPSAGGGPSTITPSTRPPTTQPPTTTQPPATPTTTAPPTTPPTTAGP